MQGITWYTMQQALHFFTRTVTLIKESLVRRLEVATPDNNTS